MNAQTLPTAAPVTNAWMPALMRRVNRLLERDLVPDALIRAGIRQLLRERLQQLQMPGQLTTAEFAALLRQSPVALNTAEANEQHYEVPTEFFQRVLGQHLKYSCGYWPDATTTLDQSEAAMLQLTSERAQLADGQQILDLGCGWGALSLFAAQQFPNSSITAVSNSRTQKQFIEAEARHRSLNNLRVLTVDMNSFSAASIGDTRFDRIVSVEMFEHMRNHGLLLERLAALLKPSGKLFIHIFTHRTHAYLYEVQDETDWMAKYFFTGGMMPSADLLSHFPDHFRIAQQWQVNGQHYEKTCRAWLARMDAQRHEIMPLLAQTYGNDQAVKWWVYWRLFFLACAELFSYHEGKEWFVSHYLLERQKAGQA